MHWFFDPALQNAKVGQEWRLSAAEGHHAADVLRIRVGESIALTNGQGLVAVCTATEVLRSELLLKVETVQQFTAEAPAIWLFQALAKGDRDELAIQMATELGAFGVGAWQASRSISRWEGQKVAKGLDRWRQICVEASKQSHRTWFPEIHEQLAVGLPRNLAGLTLVLDPTAPTRISEVEIDGADRINLIVGPEGGFTDEELSTAVDLGYKLVSLGQEVLRTSTAGPAAIVLLHGRTGRW